MTPVPAAAARSTRNAADGKVGANHRFALGNRDNRGSEVENEAVARLFRELADLLEQKGENPFKIRSYRQAAVTIEGLAVALDEVVKEGGLRELPGVGEAIAKKITEILTTGRLQKLEEIRAEVSGEGG